MKTKTLKIGTRHSKLALTQTGNALDKLHNLFPQLQFKVTEVTTIGDSDQKTDLRVSDPDFFTRELDNAVLSGELDAAVHSAKDLPYPVSEGLDWLWFPWNEDPRDALILPERLQDQTTLSIPVEMKTVDDRQLKIGVSSERRETYCDERFPAAELASIRGNIDDRIAQLDNGDYDLLIMAAAGLKRIGLGYRISEYIPATELTPPEGQGYLALTFKKGNPLFETIRQLFGQTVYFVGAGPGNPELISKRGMDLLKQCDICLYDALSAPELLTHLKPTAKSVYVGKRSGQHSLKQEQICELIADYARQGKFVVRLKGGDAGVFGRLAEEVDTMNNLKMGYKVIPGISSLIAASTGSGLNLTRRGLSRGFTALTPTKAGSNEFAPVSPDERLAFPQLFFMGLSKTAVIAQQLIDEGMKPDTPAAIIFAAGTDDEEVLCSTLEQLLSFRKDSLAHQKPGLLMVGENANGDFLYNKFGALVDKKVLLTCSETIITKASCEIRKLGGIPVALPLIELTPDVSARQQIENVARYDWLVLTSPSAVRCFLQILKDLKMDIRKLPKIMVCGKGTAAELEAKQIYPDLSVAEQYGAEQLIQSIQKNVAGTETILRLRSDQASDSLSCEIRKSGCTVDDCVLYRNEAIRYDELPSFDSVIFASSSAVKCFMAQWGIDSLNDKPVVVIGQPTLKTLQSFDCQSDILLAKEAMIADCVTEIALFYTNSNIETILRLDA